jgi:ATP-dependent helicase HrpB
LAGEAFLVVAQLDPGPGDSRIRLAAALDAAELESAAGAEATTVTALTWDDERHDLRATVARTLDGLVLATAAGKAEPGPDATAALLEHVRATRLQALPWTAAARALQQRVMFLRGTFGADWPDLSDPALLATVDTWLAPRLGGARDRAGLEALDLTRALRSLLPSGARQSLDALAPVSIPILGRRPLRVEYGAEGPWAAARLQDLFGVRNHPTVAGGRVPLVLHLLSPAGRPVQVTADLPGFWTGSYAAVRKEMAGRYPKHRWPLDPRAE